MITVTQALKQTLLQSGVSTLHGTPFNLPDETIFEPPCSMKWMNVDYSLRLGAFSYAVSGYYFGVVIGRYTSIGEDVQIGRGSHPTVWATTSPVLYQHHKTVFDFEVPEARNFSPSAEYIQPRHTYIGNDVYIGHGAFICQGVRIGDGAIVAAQAVVTKDVPPYSVVAGSPATVKKMRFDDKVIDKYLKTKWWDFAFWDLAGISVVDPNSFIDQVAEMRSHEKIVSYHPPLININELALAP